MKKVIKIIILLLLLQLSIVSCKEFIFFKVEIDEKENPLITKKVPKTTADLYEPPIIEDDVELPNPDPEGALNDWATCYVMFKEGHTHFNGIMHGNYVYQGAPWKQEEFLIVHNTKEGIEVEIDKTSTVTDIEDKLGKQGPNYIRIIGGKHKLWGMCFYFFDKKGNLLNDKILENASQYQMFFSISDVDDKGRPYDVIDTRYREYRKDETEPFPAKYFEGKTTFEQRRKLSRDIFEYVYRDTWKHDDMNDGVIGLYNERLIPPLDRKKYLQAANPYDQDYVGLKGYLIFDFDQDQIDASDFDYPQLSNGLYFSRITSLQPEFYLAVRVMKCEEGKKYVIPYGPEKALSDFGCADFYDPKPESGWSELIRFNLHLKVYASTFDSNPTNPDPMEPYYLQIGQEIGLTPEEAFEAANNVIIHGNGGGMGFGSWFL